MNRLIGVFDEDDNFISDRVVVKYNNDKIEKVNIFRGTAYIFDGDVIRKTDFDELLSDIINAEHEYIESSSEILDMIHNEFEHSFFPFYADITLGYDVVIVIQNIVRGDDFLYGFCNNWYVSDKSFYSFDYKINGNLLFCDISMLDSHLLRIEIDLLKNEAKFDSSERFILKDVKDITPDDGDLFLNLVNSFEPYLLFIEDYLGSARYNKLMMFVN